MLTQQQSVITLRHTKLSLMHCVSRLKHTKLRPSPVRHRDIPFHLPASRLDGLQPLMFANRTQFAIRDPFLQQLRDRQVERPEPEARGNQAAYQRVGNNTIVRRPACLQQ